MFWEDEMSLLEAIIMGIIQGVAEFLPISSSGHLAIFKILLNMETDTGMLFDVLLHLGTLAAVFIVFCPVLGTDRHYFEQNSACRYL